MNQMGIASVDTLRLYVNGLDYQISNRPSLSVNGESAYYLWSDSSGRKVCGSSAFWRGDDIDVRLRGRPGNPFTPPPCIITFSVSKAYHGHNAASVNREQLQGVLNEVQETLASIGIHLNIMNATVSRIDIFRDIHLSREVSLYVPVLMSLFISHLSNSRRYKTGAVFRNKRRSVIFYDKIAQMREKGLDRVRDMPSGNVLRGEYRLKSARVVRENLNHILGNKPKTEILSQTLVDNYDVIMRYHRIVSDDIFKTVMVDRKNALVVRYAANGEISLAKLQEIQAKYLVKKFGASALKRFSEVCELEERFENSSHRAERSKMIADLLAKKYPRNRAKGTRRRETEWKLLQFALLPSGIPYLSLYEELQKCFCAPELLEVERDVLKREALPITSDEIFAPNEQISSVASRLL